MNKTEMIDAIAVRGEITRRAASAAVEAMIDVIADELADGGKVSLIGFGVFATSRREARDGRHPRTGEKIKIAAANAVKFTVGRELKSRVNKPQKMVGGERNSPMTASRRMA